VSNTHDPSVRLGFRVRAGQAYSEISANATFLQAALTAAGSAADAPYFHSRDGDQANLAAAPLGSRIRPRKHKYTGKNGLIVQPVMRQQRSLIVYPGFWRKT